MQVTAYKVSQWWRYDIPKYLGKWQTKLKAQQSHLEQLGNDRLQCFCKTLENEFGQKTD